MHWRIYISVLLMIFLPIRMVGAQTPADQAAPPVPYEITRDISITGHVPWGNSFREDRVTADLYMPSNVPAGTRVPAVVITPSSGGIAAHAELFYARLLANHGIAALVIDSFMPRGIVRTVEDQRQLTTAQSVGDAIAGHRWLSGQASIDASRIVVLGVSKGGMVAINTAIVAELQRQQASEVRFAAHIAIAPGGCTSQWENPVTTGSPVVFILAEKDNYTAVPPCLDYVERMRAQGANVRLAVYPGVFHAFENIGGVYNIAIDKWNCNLFIRDNQTLVDRSTGRTIRGVERDSFVSSNCRGQGRADVGGENRVKMQMAEDLLQILRDHNILVDHEAQALLTDCAGLSDGLATNCARARAGWTGDFVALGRAYRNGRGVPRDNARAARLFNFAASRNNPIAKWELANMALNGLAEGPDLARALTLAHEAAEAGEPAAMNILGVMIRDGFGRTASDAESLPWFQRAADLRNTFAWNNLGLYYLQGRGGLPKQPEMAFELFRRSSFYNNPWGHLNLARLYLRGEGTSADRDKAVEYFRKAISGYLPAAQREAREELTRLGVTP